ncbi:hypothetical protein [Ferrovum myxofaciens]|uniref:hypothetical protein n=1 Tax=Ferrovum myxofaciens TaxID=416213 RepID=UPI003EBDB09B
MTKRKLIFTSRRNKRPPTAILDIELPELSNEAAAALADVWCSCITALKQPTTPRS